MSRQQTRRPILSDPTTSETASGESESNAETLLDQAATWADIAREARRRCEQDDDAEQELQRRRNTSGQ